MARASRAQWGISQGRSIAVRESLLAFAARPALGIYRRAPHELRRWSWQANVGLQLPWPYRDRSPKPARMRLEIRPPRVCHCFRRVAMLPGRANPPASGPLLASLVKSERLTVALTMEIQPNCVRAEALEKVLRQNQITQRFTHFLSTQTEHSIVNP